MEFVYDDLLIEDHAITCHIVAMPLEEAMREILSSTNIEFKIFSNQQIVLFKGSADRKQNISGNILDNDNGEPLPFADVYLEDTHFGGISNAAGYFVIVNVPPGEYTLVAEYLGYDSARMPITIPGNTAKIELSLQPKMIPGQGITVTDENWEVAQVSETTSEVRVSPRQISLLASIGEGDLFRSLQLLPGVSAESDGSSRLFIRGGTPDQNLVILDGMTIYYVDHLFGFLSAFNNRAIKDVRIYKGGYPAKYGGRTSSVIELTGTSGNNNKLRAGVDLNLVSGNFYTTIPLKGRGSLFFSGRRSYQDIVESTIYNEIKSIFVGQDEANFLLGADLEKEDVRSSLLFYDINSKLSLALTNRDVLALSVYLGRDDLDLEQDFILPAGDQEPDAQLTAFEKISWSNTGYSGKWSRLWSDQIYSTILAAYTEYDTDYAETDLFEDIEFSPSMIPAPRRIESGS